MGVSPGEAQKIKAGVGGEVGIGWGWEAAQISCSENRGTNGCIFWSPERRPWENVSIHSFIHSFTHSLSREHPVGLDEKFRCWPPVSDSGCLQIPVAEQHPRPQESKPSGPILDVPTARSS